MKEHLFVQIVTRAIAIMAEEDAIKMSPFWHGFVFAGSKTEEYGNEIRGSKCSIDRPTKPVHWGQHGRTGPKIAIMDARGNLSGSIFVYRPILGLALISALERGLNVAKKRGCCRKERFAITPIDYEKHKRTNLLATLFDHGYACYKWMKNTFLLNLVDNRFNWQHCCQKRFPKSWSSRSKLSHFLFINFRLISNSQLKKETQHAEYRKTLNESFRKVVKRFFFISCTAARSNRWRPLLFEMMSLCNLQ